MMRHDDELPCHDHDDELPWLHCMLLVVCLIATASSAFVASVASASLAQEPLREAPTKGEERIIPESAHEW